MTKRRVFYSFHYQKDAWRVNQIRNMGVVDGNEPVTPNNWEEIKRNGDTSIQKWIEKEISKCSCVVVLVGSETSERKWVDYEIKEAWKQRKGLLGIYIHNLKDENSQSSKQGNNPFANYVVTTKNNAKLSDFIRCYNPNPYDAYNDIATNLASLVEDAIKYCEKETGLRL